MTLIFTVDRVIVKVILVHISGRDLLTHQIRCKIGKTFCGWTRRTYGRMDVWVPLGLLVHCWAMT